MSEQINTYSVAVLTPTFRGRRRLYNVFDSISSQEIKPNEWVIVIDGEDKETEEIAKSFKLDNVFIKVLVINHNHKKSALNAGLKIIKSNLVLIADDDDTFPRASLKIFLNEWRNIGAENHHKYVGVTGLCSDERGNIVGDKFPLNVWDSNAIESFFKFKIAGEKWGILRVDILLKYPFFEDAEGYVGESTVWMEIAKKYKTRYINQIVRIYNIRPDSIMTAEMNSIKIKNNCQAYVYGYRYTSVEFIKYIYIRPKYIIGCSSNYIRFLLHCFRFKKTKKWMLPKFDISNISAIALGLPFGVLFFSRDIFMNN